MEALIVAEAKRREHIRVVEFIMINLLRGGKYWTVGDLLSFVL